MTAPEAAALEPAGAQQAPARRSYLWEIAGWLLCAALALAFVLVTMRRVPIATVFEMDGDEGLNLMKAALFKGGMPLYTTIWSDQPPIFTFLLSTCFRITGDSVYAARLLVLAMSALLLFSLAAVLRMTSGVVAAVAGVALLAVSADYMRLSVSVMIGLPALALGMASILLLYLAVRRRSFATVALSGSLLALSMQTKLFTTLLVPWMILHLAVFFPAHATGKRWQGKLAAVATWLAALAITYALVAWWFGALDLNMLIGAHTGDQVGKAEMDSTPHMLEKMAKWDYQHAYLAIAGVVGMLAMRRWQRLLPAAWLITAYLILRQHSPVWDDHYPLMSIPLMWLAAYAVGDAAEWLFQGWNRPMAIPWRATRVAGGLAVLALVTFAAAGVPEKVSDRWNVKTMLHIEPEGSQAVLAKMKERAAETRWVFTDRPIYAFYAGMKVPPEVAVISVKRYRSGALTRDDVLAIIAKYQPEQIVLARFLRNDRTFLDAIATRWSMFSRPSLKPAASRPADLPRYARAMDNRHVTLYVREPKR